MKWPRSGCAGWLFLVAGLIIFIQFGLRWAPSLAERVYGDSVYSWMRGALDQVHLPLAGLQIMLAILFLFVIANVGYLIHSRVTWQSKLLRIGRYWLIILSILVIWFYVFWGFNYARPDLSARMQLDSVKPDSSWLIAELDRTIDLCNQLCAEDELAFLRNLSEAQILSCDFDVQTLNKMLEGVLNQLGYSLRINPNLQFISPDGFLMHWSTTGIYWPFTGESNVDRGVHYIKKPVTIVHELAHAHGLTSEGDCNFVAYLACRQSENKLHQYSANLSYLGYLMRDALKLFGRDGLDKFYARMSPGLIEHRQQINMHHNSYKDYFPAFRDVVYDSYLKTQGVKGGMENYNYFVTLKYNWDSISMDDD